MEFKDRKGKNLNRKKLKIISQTPTELIVDMERFDEVEEEGTKIDASVFNTFQSEISISNNNSNNAISIANSAKNESSQAKEESATALSTANSADSKSSQALENSNVAMEHEATVSKISDDELYYLESRGIPERKATEMIIMGFEEPFTKQLPMEYAVELNRLISFQMEGAIG